jgi:hypothetical protein
MILILNEMAGQFDELHYLTFLPSWSDINLNFEIYRPGNFANGVRARGEIFAAENPV